MKNPPTNGKREEKRCAITDQSNCDCKVCTGEATITLRFPKPDSRRDVTVGIDMGSGDSKSAVSLAREDEDGKIHIIACESVSNELASFIDTLQAQNAELVSKVKVAVEAISRIEQKKFGDTAPEHEIAMAQTIARQALAFIRSSPYINV